MPRRSHKESRSLFINEAKKLYQKEFIKWFGLTTSINPILRLFRANDPNVPTLYVMGDEDYMFLSPVKMIVRRHLSAELSIISKCGHVVNVEQPTVFNTLVLDWLHKKTRDLTNTGITQINNQNSYTT